MIAKLDDGSWSAPSAIGTAGFGFGSQLGAEVTDFLIVLNSRTAVKTFMAAGSMTLGGNLSVAVGPLGRNAEGSGTLNSKGKAAALYSYSKTKGLFGGVSIEGSIIVERQDANRQAYGQDFTSKELLSGVVPPPPWAAELIETLQTNIGMPGGRTWIDDHPDELGRDEDDDGYGDASDFGDRRSTPTRNTTGYAFAEPNVSSFSSNSTPQRPKPRSRASTLSSVFKMDLMGNEIKGLPSGIGFPRKRSSGPGSPSFSRRTDRAEPMSPFEDDEERKYSRQNEYNPFDDALASRHSGLDDDMDLSREIISPWNNDKGLPSPQSKYKSDLQSGSPIRGQLEFKEEYRSPNRSRASTLQNSDLPSSRPRSGSNALRVSSPLTKYNYQDSEQESDQVESSLAGQMSRLRAGSTASNRMSRFGKSGYGTPSEDFDNDDRLQQSDRDYNYPISPAPAMPRSSSSKLLSFVNRKRSNTTNSRGGTDFVVDPAIHQADRNIVLGTPQSAQFGDFEQPADLDPMYGAGTKPTADQLSFAVKKDLADAMKDGRERALAIHDYEGQEEGDLSMRQGDVIIITERSESQDDW